VKHKLQTESIGQKLIKPQLITTKRWDKFSSQMSLINPSIDPIVSGKLIELSSISPTPISIEQFLIAGKGGPVKERDNFMFTCNELAIRLAHAILDMMRMPPELLAMPDCQYVIKQYTKSFAALLKIQDKEKRDAATLQEFAKFLNKLKGTLNETAANLASAVMDMSLQRGMGLDDANCPLSMSINYYLDRLYTAMISMQMLTSQHLAIYGYWYTRSCPNQTGIINTQTQLTSVLLDCFDDAAFDCENNFMVAPSIVVKNYNSTAEDHDVNEPVSGVHIPAHLYTIFFEVFQNSMRATVEHNFDNKDNLPPIRAIVCQSNDDFTIKISDQGGGAARHNAEKWFFYLYTTKHQEANVGKFYAGYGIPLARLYARYFQGDLRVASYEGYGTDVYIYIRALAKQAVERLPVYEPFNTDTKYESDMGQDWTSKFGSDIQTDVKTANTH